MTATLERPDPYSIRPSSTGWRKTRRQAASPGQAASTAPADDSQAARAELFRKGLRAMSHERLDDARTCLEAVATEPALDAGEPLAVDALAYLSAVTWSLGDALEAIAQSDRALELGPDRFAPNQKAGETALRLGLLDRAESRFLAALRASEPGTPDARAAEACLRTARKRTAAGIKHGTRGPGLSALAARLLRIRRRQETAQPEA
jgi:tetratricopeptide (TPR) repeat protein